MGEPAAVSSWQIPRNTGRQRQLLEEFVTWTIPLPSSFRLIDDFQSHTIHLQRTLKGWEVDLTSRIPFSLDCNLLRAEIIRNSKQNNGICQHINIEVVCVFLWNLYTVELANISDVVYRPLVLVSSQDSWRTYQPKFHPWKMINSLKQDTILL